MPKRKISIEILAPTDGIETRLSGSMINPRSVPTIQDGISYYGVVQKEYGTSLLCSATATMPGAVPINALYEAVFPEATKLQAFNHTGMYTYVSTASGFTDDGQVYTGTFTDIWSMDMHNSNMFYTNGVDLVQYKLAYNSTGTDCPSVTLGSYKAYAVVSFANHLNLYHTEESGSESYKRVRWSKVGLLGHTSTDWTTGTANFVDIQDAEGSLLTAELLGGGAVAIYFEGSIHLQEWVGGTTVYSFTKMITGLDIPSRRCVVRNDAIHYVLTRENVYEYRGGREFIAIGDPIKEMFVSEMNAPNMGYAHLQFIKEDNELRVYIPTGSATQPDTCFVCKVAENNKWFKSTREYTASGTTSRPNSVTIGDLVGTIGAQTWKFGDMFVDAGAPTYLLSDTGGNIVKMDKMVYSLSLAGTSTAQSFVFQSKDLSASNNVDPEYAGEGKGYDTSEYATHKSRWITIRAECKGYGDVTAYYSVDGSQTWTACAEGSKSLTTLWNTFQWDVDITSELFAVRLTNSGENEVLNIRMVKIEFIPGSEV